MLARLFKYWKEPEFGLKELVTQFVKTVSPRQPEAINQELRRVEQVLAETYPVEALSVQSFTGFKTNLLLELAVVPVDKRYPRVDMSFLNLSRHYAGLGCAGPRFAIFALDNPRYAVSATVTGRANFDAQLDGTADGDAVPAIVKSTTVLPALKQATTKELLRSVGIGSPKGKTLTWSFATEFADMLPKSGREQINALKVDFDQIYLVAEAPEWQLNQTIQSSCPGKDVLILAQKGDLFWHVATVSRVSPSEYFRA